MEIAIAVPPWPKWINMPFENPETAVVVMARRVFSAHAGDALEPDCVARLIERLLTPEETIHAWLWAFGDYRREVVRELGHSAARGLDSELPTISPTSAFSALTGQLKEGLMVLSYTAQQFAKVGLPPTFLRRLDEGDRIGLRSLDGAVFDPTRYPSLEEMLDSYELVIGACGEHFSDCLVASRQHDRESLAGLVRLVLADVVPDLQLHDQGLVEGERYEELHQSTL